MGSDLLRRILYVHYQKDLTEGSTVQVARFSEHFGALCEQRGIVFEVMGPQVQPLPSVVPSSRWQHWRRTLGRYYLRDFKVLWQQWRRSFAETRELRRRCPDLVITVYDAETLSIHWACRRLGIPVISVFNGLDRFELKHTYLRLKQLPCFDRLFGNCHALALSSGAITVTETIAAPLRRCNPQAKPIVVAPNGVDLERFDPNLDASALRRRLGWGAQTTVIGYVGSFMLWHKPQRLVNAFHDLWRRGNDVALLLVGRRLPEVEVMIARLPASARERVVWVGLVPHEQVPEYLAAIDVAVLPYTLPYCSPMKLIEYMAMGKACVAPDTPGVREVMAPSQEGLVFAPNDEAAFAAVVQRLVTDPPLRARLGAAARRRVERALTWRCHAERAWEAVIEAWVWFQRQRRSFER